MNQCTANTKQCKYNWIHLNT